MSIGGLGRLGGKCAGKSGDNAAGVAERDGPGGRSCQGRGTADEDRMDREQIIARIQKCNCLPTLPTVAMRVLEVARNDQAGVGEIAELVSMDPALSSKVLRTVNSAFYGMAKPVATVSQALVVLGTESVKTLIVGFSLIKGLNQGQASGQMQVAYWRRSLHAATTARLLCQKLGALEREELFLAALLRDVGIQVLKQAAPDQYDALLASSPAWTGAMVRRELAAVGLTHVEAGAMLAEQWRLPPMLTQIIRWHHCPRGADAEFVRGCRIIRLAGLCAEVFMGHGHGRYVDAARRYAHAGFGLDAAACDAVLTQASAGMKELTALFELDIGQLKPYEEILADANEALQDLSLKSQIQASLMKAQAETDPLTGLANRRKLDEKISAEFLRACRFNRPLSVIFVDVDRFKSVNDTYGHAVGDQALTHVAHLLQSHARPMDTVGRYGGEEFVLVLPETSLAAAANLAEKLRVGVQSTPLALADGPLTLTISAGVAGFEGAPGPYRQPAVLVQAADRATYAAKAAGRNTIRVFAPRIKKSEPAAG